MNSRHKLIYDINIVTRDINSIKKDFDAYVCNKEVPLCVRWEFFEKAPSFLMEQDSCIHTFNWEKKHGKIVWHDDFGCNRYQTVEMKDIVNSMWENEWEDEKINDMKEEVLSKNLGSFIYDW